MSHHFDPMEKAMQDAQQRVINAGMSGGDVHSKVDDATVIMATMGWAVQKIEKSNKELVKSICGGDDDTMRDKIKKNGPAASVGAIVVGAFAFVKDWLSNGG